MLLSDWLLFFDKTIIALSGRHFEYFFTFSKNNYTCLRPRRSIGRVPPLAGLIPLRAGFESYSGSQNFKGDLIGSPLKFLISCADENLRKLALLRFGNLP